VRGRKPDVAPFVFPCSNSAFEITPIHFAIFRAPAADGPLLPPTIVADISVMMAAIVRPMRQTRLPDPLRLIGPTICSTPVGRFKRSGTGADVAGTLGLWLGDFYTNGQSRFRNRLIGRENAIRLTASKHCIDDGQQLAHSGDQGDFLGLSGLDETLARHPFHSRRRPPERLRQWRHSPATMRSARQCRPENVRKLHAAAGRHGKHPTWPCLHRFQLRSYL